MRSVWLTYSTTITTWLKIWLLLSQHCYSHSCAFVFQMKTKRNEKKNKCAIPTALPLVMCLYVRCSLKFIAYSGHCSLQCVCLVFFNEVGFFFVRFRSLLNFLNCSFFYCCKLFWFYGQICNSIHIIFSWAHKMHQQHLHFFLHALQLFSAFIISIYCPFHFLFWFARIFKSHKNLHWGKHSFVVNNNNIHTYLTTVPYLESFSNCWHPLHLLHHKTFKLLLKLLSKH